jgi:hypothetical protein
MEQDKEIYSFCKVWIMERKHPDALRKMGLQKE